MLRWVLLQDRADVACYFIQGIPSGLITFFLMNEQQLRFWPKYKGMIFLFCVYAVDNAVFSMMTSFRKSQETSEMDDL